MREWTQDNKGDGAEILNHCYMCWHDMSGYRKAGYSCKLLQTRGTSSLDITYQPKATGHMLTRHKLTRHKITGQMLFWDSLDRNLQAGAHRREAYLRFTRQKLTRHKLTNQMPLDICSLDRNLPDRSLPHTHQTETYQSKAYLKDVSCLCTQASQSLLNIADQNEDDSRQTLLWVPPSHLSRVYSVCVQPQHVGDVANRCTISSGHSDSLQSGLLLNWTIETNLTIRTQRRPSTDICLP